MFNNKGFKKQVPLCKSHISIQSQALITDYYIDIWEMSSMHVLHQLKYCNVGRSEKLLIST